MKNSEKLNVVAIVCVVLACVLFWVTMFCIFGWYAITIGVSILMIVIAGLLGELSDDFEKSEEKELEEVLSE